MLHLTQKGDYALRRMVYLATKPAGEMSLISKIASSVDVSQALLAKIFQQFNKHGLVKSYRGTGGGFILGRPPEQITLLEREVQEKMKAVLCSFTLKDLAGKYFFWPYKRP